MRCSLRELAALSTSTLADGRRGLERPPARDRASALSQRMRTLFFSGSSSSASEGKRRLQMVHGDPPIYVVPHFLTARELDVLDERITSERRRFKRSHTDADEGEVNHGDDDRTSISLALPKAADATLRAIEARAAELVGLPSDHVEPLQIVHYSEGARFDMHHDVAPITIRGEEESERAKGEEDSENAIKGEADECTLHGRDGAPPRDGSPTHELTKDDVIIENQEGPRRLVTLFVYLNTLPDGVGHTEFPLLRDAAGAPFSVRPRSGTALVFCNVDADGEPDARLCHRACPVPAGHTKFGMNIWISDVSQQAHAVSAPPARKPSGGAAGGRGLLAPLLFVHPEDLAPPPPAALVGLRVRRCFGEPGIFEGRVASYAADLGYHLEYSDGDEEDIGVDDLLALPLAAPASLVGRRVARHFPGHGRFEGEIVSFEDGHEGGGQRGYRLRYDDGDEEDERPLAEVLRLLLPSSGNRKKAGKKRSRSDAHTSIPTKDMK